MSRIISDGGFMTWEVYTTGGKFGLPERPKIIFQCLSDPDRRARYVIHEGTNSTAERAVQQLPDDALRELLERSTDLD